jgi:hypothetical protein
MRVVVAFLLSLAAAHALTSGAFTVLAPSTTGRVTVPASGGSTVSSAGFNAVPLNSNSNSNSGNNLGTTFNGALGGFQNLNNGGPFNNNDHNQNQNGVDADTVINDNNRFNIAEIAGTWAIQASGFAHRPHVEKRGRLVHHPTFLNDTVANDVATDFVGLLCIDRNGGCSLEIVVNIAGSEAILRQADTTCTAQVHGNGQGFIRTNLVVTAGCDRHSVFPTSLVLPFVIGANGNGFFLVQGCLFGLAENPFKQSNSALPGVFGCAPAHSGSDESDVSGLAPITMSGEMNRQNGQVRQNNKNQWSMNGGMGPWAGNDNSNNGNSNGNYNNNDHGNTCNCNNWVNANGNNNPCACRDQDHCLPFDNFLLPFSLHVGTPSGQCDAFFQFRPGCIDERPIIGGHDMDTDWEDWPY